MACLVCNYTHQFVLPEADVFSCVSCCSYIKRNETYGGDNQPEKGFLVVKSYSRFSLGDSITFNQQIYTIIGCYQFFIDSSIQHVWVLYHAQHPTLYVWETVGEIMLLELSMDVPSFVWPMKLGSPYTLKTKDNPYYICYNSKNELTRLAGEVTNSRLLTDTFFLSKATNKSGNVCVLIKNKNKYIVLFGGCVRFLAANKTLEVKP